MTDDIIKAITQAETQGEQFKAEARERATFIIEDAEMRATQKVKTTEEICKAYRDTQMKNAQTDAELSYAKLLSEKEAEAKDYCAKVLEDMDTVVSEIVGRILGGDC